jgi:hypothetical protein
LLIAAGITGTVAYISTASGQADEGATPESFSSLGFIH